MRRGWWSVIFAAVGTGALCAALALFPRLLEAGGTVTNCTNQAQLQNALAGGGTVTFNCGTATIPITGTLVITLPTTIDGGGVITLD
ncbi:MAG: hypothetical protein NZ773_10375, partial [Dehalococcoidia bacterium]|nr:hypothetical protein [Dehalococcoidia bacterium]